MHWARCLENTVFQTEFFILSNRRTVYNVELDKVRHYAFQLHDPRVDTYHLVRSHLNRQPEAAHDGVQVILSISVPFP